MKKRLVRTRKDNVIAGVCGGIARYLDIDVIIVRIVWVISALMGGLGFGTYILCALIIPKEKSNGYKYNNTSNLDLNEDEYDASDRYEDEYDNSDEYEDDYYEEAKDDKTKKYLGMGLIIFGLAMGFKNFFPNMSFSFLWPLILIGIGVFLINKHDDTEEE